MCCQQQVNCLTVIKCFHFILNNTQIMPILSYSLSVSFYLFLFFFLYISFCNYIFTLFIICVYILHLVCKHFHQMIEIIKSWVSNSNLTANIFNSLIILRAGYLYKCRHYIDAVPELILKIFFGQACWILKDIYLIKKNTCTLR